MHSKNIPEFILSKDFLGYSVAEDDASGFDYIMNNIMNLLLIFRLFKIGDIFFNDMMIEKINSDEIVFSKFRMDNISAYKYILDNEYIDRFVKFKNINIEKLNHINKYLAYPIGQFLQGGNKTFLYRKEAISRIVDYVVVLESLFLVDSHHWFLQRTLSKRIEGFLSENDIGQIVKYMYNERSKIVHGNYIDINKKSEKKLINNLQNNMIPFECIIRKIILKMLNIKFESKKELKEYMQSIYEIPTEVIKEMEDAKVKSEKILNKYENNNGNLTTTWS